MGWEVKKKLGGSYDLIKKEETIFIYTDSSLIDFANRRSEYEETIFESNIQEEFIPEVNLITDVQNSADGLAVLEYLGWIIQEDESGWVLTKGSTTLFARRSSDDLISIANSEKKSS
jgi:hypothetical protein